MKRLALLLPALFVGVCSAEARSRPPTYDCSEERTVFQPIYQTFRVYEGGLYWYLSLDENISLSLFVVPHTDNGRRALVENGIFHPAAEGLFMFTIRGSISEPAARADLRAGDRVLPGVPLGSLYHVSRSANVTAGSMVSLLSAGADLTIIFRDGEGRAIRQATIPITLLQNSLNELRTTLVRVRENLTDPPNRCGQVVEF